MTGADVLIRSLKAQNVRCIVGMPGNQNIDIYDALLRAGGIDHYLIRNELGATLLANGYARASGEVGVALTVPGPGATNASTGIVDAHTDCVPVLLITGGTEVAFNGRDRSKCFHGLDQAAFFAPITRFFARPERIEDIPEAVTGAFAALRAPQAGPGRNRTAHGRCRRGRGGRCPRVRKRGPARAGPGGHPTRRGSHRAHGAARNPHGRQYGRCGRGLRTSGVFRNAERPRHLQPARQGRVSGLPSAVRRSLPRPAGQKMSFNRPTG